MTFFAPAARWAEAFSLLDAELLVRQLGGVLDRRHLELLPVGRDGVALDLHFEGEAAVHAVEAEQVGIGFDRAQIVDRDDLDVVVPVALNDGAQDVAADAAKAIDSDADSHDGSSNSKGGKGRGLLTTGP